MLAHTILHILISYLYEVIIGGGYSIHSMIACQWYMLIQYKRSHKGYCRQLC